MNTNGKLMDMLTGYAASHQHPFNIFVHLVGIPTIMLGVLIPASMLGVEVSAMRFTLGHALILGLFAFYLTLDRVFAVAFLLAALALSWIASGIAAGDPVHAWSIAAVAFFGGYALQFVGHFVERSMPVLVKHPIQANLAAPFFTVVEISKLIGARAGLFDAVQHEVAQRRQNQGGVRG